MNEVPRPRAGEPVKENAGEAGAVPARLVAALALLTAGALLAAAAADRRLPAPLPRDAPPHVFSAARARDHLVNLTAIGPRVAGSYENEVVAVRTLVAAARALAAAASQHNLVDYDVFTASGAFSLSFLDGMTNYYRDVQSVVVRVRGAGEAAGGAAAAKRTAILLNCHFDTVPDSPGASDDGAGCAVALETVRALAASARPLRHRVLLLLNGAEENILQASHAFVTGHPWARSARAFINIEACGAGGREVLFQAGPHDPWIVEAYAGAAPHPFASSLAQELFESGLIPADTDFRIFRDFGNMSGVDLAWSSNGYVYHTRLDTADRVPPAVLQRTGDNVLALAHGLLSSERLQRAAERERQPVFFDVVGLVVVAARAPAAALAALLLLALTALALLLSARDAARELYLPMRAWAGVVARTAWRGVCCSAAGACCSAALALLLHASGARLSFYSQPTLLLPLYALPALAGAWADARLRARGSRGALVLARGWAAWRAWRDALALLAALALVALGAVGLRSAFLPALWTLPALASLPLRAAPRAGRRAAAALHALGALLPTLQTAYLALNSVDMFVPIMGRAGTPPLPADVMMSLAVSSLTLLTFSWMLPFVVAAKRLDALLYGLVVTSAAGALYALSPLGAAYSAERPQRLMLFHTRRSYTPLHELRPASVEHFYWLPELDGNTPHSMDAYLEGAAGARATTAEECARWAYCGAPYFLPVLSRVSRGHALAAPGPPLARLRLEARLAPGAAGAGGRARSLRLRLAGPQHAVLVLAPAAGARVRRCSGLQGEPREGPAWGARRTYFVTLHAARAPLEWRLECALELEAGAAEPAGWVQVSAAGHAMFGPARLAAPHARLLAAAPPHAAATGWGVDLHVVDL